MKILIVTIFILNMSISYSQSIKFSELFITKDSLIDLEKIPNILPKNIDEKVVEDFFCQIKNECFFNIENNRKYFYYPFYKLDSGSFFIATYLVTDKYQYDVYLVTIEKEQEKRISTLHIYSYINRLDPKVSSKLKNDTIEIKRKLYKECDDNRTDCFTINEEKYKVNIILERMFLLPNANKSKLIIRKAN
jgi:hypothetical protein